MVEPDAQEQNLWYLVTWSFLDRNRTKRIGWKQAISTLYIPSLLNT